MIDSINTLREYLSEKRKVVITSHRNPDGDALGSSLALMHYLQAKGHEVTVVLPSEYPDNFDWLHDVKSCVIYDIDKESAKQHIEEAALFFFLDFNSYDRIDPLKKFIEPNPAPKVMIDHHLHPDDIVNFSFCRTDASSTCELIYDFIDAFGEADTMDVKIADMIYVGVITDTGSFSYSTSAALYKKIGHLKDLGIDDYDLHDKIYNRMAIKNLQLLGHCLNNRMELYPEYKAGLIYLTKEDYKTYDIQRGDTEGIISYVMMLKDVKIAAFIREQPTLTKISLRSKGDISVQEIAKNHFNGGGHKNASGGMVYKKLDDAITYFKRVLPRYTEKIKE